MRLKERFIISLGRLLRPLPEPIKQRLRIAAVRIGLFGPADAPEVEVIGSEAAASAYLEISAALNERRYQDVLDQVAALELTEDAREPRDRFVFRARLARFDTLVAMGQGFDALEYLNELDGIYGARWSTLRRRAQLGVFTGDTAGALAAVERALLHLPAKKGRNSHLAEMALMKVDLLTAAGRCDEAREFFLRIFPADLPARPLTDRQIASLRKTVNGPEALRQFKDILLPSFAFNGYRALHSLFHYSIAARDLDQHEEALYAIQRRFIIGSRILKPAERKKPFREDWTDAARRALLDLREDLSAAGVEFFLISGTLLGCVREGGILGHDKDVDVGVMDHYDFERVRGALSGTGHFMLLPVITERILRVKHSNGVMIDVFFHWEEDGRLYHEGQKTRWWNSPFRLVETDFLGEKFLVPDDADTYLTENYGDWRTPVTDFETFCDTPNMSVTDQNETLWYYYRILLDYYHTGSVQLFEKVWARLNDLGPVSIEFRMAVEAAQARMASVVPAVEPAAQTNGDTLQ